MIEKLEFYHGAAIVRLIEDGRCKSVRKSEYGYLVNEDRSILVKYTTKAQSPWRFTITKDDIERFDRASQRSNVCILVLVCGGDGVCASPWEAARELLSGSAGWLSAKRSHNGCYAFSGPAGTLKKKVALNQWPGIVFDLQEIE